MKDYTVGTMPYRGVKDKLLKRLGFRKVPTYSLFTGGYEGYKWRFMPNVKVNESEVLP